MALGPGRRRRPPTLAGDHGKLQSARFSPDGTRLATVGDDGTLLLWDPASGAPVGRFSRPGTQLADVAFSPNGAAIAVLSQVDGKRGEALLLTAKDLTLQRQRAAAPDDPPRNGGPDDRATAVAFSPDGRLLALPLVSGRVVLWDVADPTAEARVLDGHAETAPDAAFSPDGAVLSTSGADRFVHL